MKPISPRERTATLEKQARESYAKHVLVRSAPDRWLIARPDSGDFATEIVLVGHGRGDSRILIHGDGPDLLVGRGSYSGMDLLPWLASSSADYLAHGKVIAGTATEWVAEVALDWLESVINDEREELHEDGEGGRTGELFVGLKDARECLTQGDLDEPHFRESLYELTEDCEFGMNVGREPSWDVFAAREAVRTLLRLLEAPPQADVP